MEFSTSCQNYSLSRPQRFYVLVIPIGAYDLEDSHVEIELLLVANNIVEEGKNLLQLRLMNKLFIV